MSALSKSLISVTPYGKGTPLVESIFSYLLRLSEENMIPLSELVRYVSESSEDPLSVNRRGNIDNFWLKKLIIGNGSQVGAFIRRLEELTGLTDLHLLTLRNWSHLFLQGMVHKHRFFDPMSNLEYEPLLYCVDPVYWTLGGTPLELTCPNPACHEASSIAQMGTELRKCNKCGTTLNRYAETASAALGNATRVFLNYNSRDYSMWVTQTIGGMLAYTGPTDGFIFFEAYNNALSYLSIKSYSAAQRAFSISRGPAEKWRKGRGEISLDQFLNIIYCLRVSGADFFSQKQLAVSSVDELRPSPRMTRMGIGKQTRSKIEDDGLHAKMERDLKIDKMTRLTFKAYCQHELGRSSSNVRKHAKDLAEQFHVISVENASHRSDTTLFGRKAELCRAAIKCEQQEVLVHTKNLGPYLAKPGMMREPWARVLIAHISDHGAAQALRDLCEGNI